MIRAHLIKKLIEVFEEQCNLYNAKVASSSAKEHAKKYKLAIDYIKSLPGKPKNQKIEEGAAIELRSMGSGLGEPQSLYFLIIPDSFDLISNDWQIYPTTEIGVLTESFVSSQASRIGDTLEFKFIEDKGVESLVAYKISSIES